MSNLLYKDLTQVIIGAYFEVYNHTSRIYPEYIYEACMIEELHQCGLKVSQQEKYEVFYKEKQIGLQILDLCVENLVVIENKVADTLTRLHKAQTISYLKVADKAVGLLLNFGAKIPEFKRLYFNSAKKPGVSQKEQS